MTHGKRVGLLFKHSSLDKFCHSFSPPIDLSNGYPKSSAEEGSEKAIEKDEEGTLQLNLISKTWGTSPDHPGAGKDESLRSSNNPERGSQMTGLGHARPNAG
ncbi:hypothetical protein NE237_029318 [Protea cynaroides]|uniref:Uncharacterized protein n=1 Tax=Protea cynaroides TaxID=273540 RepID=A0A9Q0JUP2_9MAGN|nr:hypothetical protein NE237_029318 [Protea cynaroides]